MDKRLDNEGLRCPVVRRNWSAAVLVPGVLDGIQWVHFYLHVSSHLRAGDKSMRYDGFYGIWYLLRQVCMRCILCGNFSRQRASKAKERSRA